MHNWKFSCSNWPLTNHNWVCSSTCSKLAGPEEDISTFRLRIERSCEKKPAFFVMFSTHINLLILLWAEEYCQGSPSVVPVQFNRVYKVHYAPIAAIQPRTSLASHSLIECSALYQSQRVPSNYFQFHSGNRTCDIGYLAKQLLVANPSNGHGKVMASGNI